MCGAGRSHNVSRIISQLRLDQSEAEAPCPYAGPLLFPFGLKTRQLLLPGEMGVMEPSCVQ